jgi:hypothetical protein
VVDGDNPGHGRRKGKSRQHGPPAAAAQLGPVAEKRKPAVQRQNHQQRHNGPTQAGERRQVHQAARGVAQQPLPAHAGLTVAGGVAGQLVAGGIKAIARPVERLGVGDEGRLGQPPRLQIEERVFAHQHLFGKAADLRPK